MGNVNVKSKLCGNIGYFRYKSGMTQREVAEKLGITPKRIGHWECYHCEPNSELIVKLAVLFNITCDELLGREIPIDFNYTGAQI